MLNMKDAEFRLLPSSQLQRPVRFRNPESAMVDQIVSSYEPILDTPVFVSRRDGHLWLIDGAARREARRRLGYHDVACAILTLTEAEEDRLFELSNSGYRSIAL